MEWSKILHKGLEMGLLEPKVGMGATLLFDHDRRAGTIVHIDSDCGRPLVTVQEDLAIPDRFNPENYTYEPDENGKYWYFRLGRQDIWQEVYESILTGRWNYTDSGVSLLVGERIEYHAPEF